MIKKKMRTKVNSQSIKKHYLSVQDHYIQEIKDEIAEAKERLKQEILRRKEMAKNEVKAGDSVKLLVNVVDAYQETYFTKGDTVEILDVDPFQINHEYEIPNGFWLPRHAFEKTRRKKK